VISRHLIVISRSAFRTISMCICFRMVSLVSCIPSAGKRTVLTQTDHLLASRVKLVQKIFTRLRCIFYNLRSAKYSCSVPIFYTSSRRREALECNRAVLGAFNLYLSSEVLQIVVGPEKEEITVPDDYRDSIDELVREIRMQF